MDRKNIKSECDFIGLKNNRLNYRCKECKGKSTKPINGLSKKFPSVYQYCDGDLNKFVLLSRKGIYPYEYMDSWDKDYNHAQKVWEVFGINNLGKYHNLYFQCDTLLLADVFEKFRDTCIEIYGLDPSHFLSAPELAWQACLKKQM